MAIEISLFEDDERAFEGEQTRPAAPTAPAPRPPTQPAMMTPEEARNDARGQLVAFDL